MNNFFRYSNYKTCIHKINPLIKIICFFIYTLLAFVVFKNIFFIILSIVINLLFILFLFFLSKISLKNIFYQLLKNKFLILFIFIINLLTVKKSDFVFSININFFEKNEILIIAFFKTLKIIFRIFKMISISNILIMTTLPQEISRCFCLLIYPFKFIKIPISDIGMIITISIRFVSEFFLEITRLYKAQISRGAKTSGFLNKIKMFILIINPLFNFIFKMGDDLVFALEARGYKTNSKRTHYQKLEYSKLDIFAIFFMIVFTFFFVIMKTLDYLY